MLEKPSFLEAEKDLVRRSSGKNEVGRFLLEKEALPQSMEGLKMALSAATAVEEVRGFREVEEEEEVVEGSNTARRSQRHEGKRLVKCYSWCWAQDVEGRWA
ncbi:hypothetical protein ACFX14_044760 [Malus domestica]